MNAGTMVDCGIMLQVLNYDNFYNQWDLHTFSEYIREHVQYIFVLKGLSHN
jgi:hypothetical protein